eukprot:COSAG04_NODE_2513_length_3987_cov_11.345165_4_plen_90_part_00
MVRAAVAVYVPDTVTQWSEDSGHSRCWPWQCAVSFRSVSEPATAPVPQNPSIAQVVCVSPARMISWPFESTDVQNAWNASRTHTPGQHL